MLESLRVRQFKSLDDTGDVRLAPLTVLFGPNAAGKSNFLDAIQILSRLASERTLADAFSGPVRGLPLESFAFPEDGLPGLLAATSLPRFSLSADVRHDSSALRYSVDVAIRPSSGTLTVQAENLWELSRGGEPRGTAAIQTENGEISIRRRERGRPRREPSGQGFTQLSDRRLSGPGYRVIERARSELASWRTYYLDPRVAMRGPQAPQEVDEIGPLGEHLAPFLYRLQAEHPKLFLGVRRTVRTLIPSIEDVRVDLDTRRGVLDVEIWQNGTAFSSRIVSEGTLRILALSCIALNPWGGSLVAFEEPENGVHPHRIELTAQMLGSLATDPSRPRQVVVTTHSPTFCGAVVRAIRTGALPRGAAALFQVVREGRRTRITPFAPSGPLFDDVELAKGLAAHTEDGVFEGLLLRGLLDA